MAFEATEELVVSAETALGRRLPRPHRDRLIRNNGGEVRAARDEWRLFPVWDPTSRKTMGRTANHIIRENESLRRDWPDILPSGHIAIADNGGGDLLVLAPEGDEVRFWDHETGDLVPVIVEWSEV